jgi:hypothetical protein
VGLGVIAVATSEGGIVCEVAAARNGNTRGAKPPKKRIAPRMPAIRNAKNTPSNTTTIDSSPFLIEEGRFGLS